MQRIFSTFVNGRIGAGLLVIRVVAGVAVIDRGIEGARVAAAIGGGVLHVLAIAAGLFLVVGIWTPLIGILVAALEVWTALSQPGIPWTAILLAAIGIGLTLLGPGTWSLDARLFGWRRIEIPARQPRTPSTSDSLD
jgi:putative oxidoreductase